MELQAHPWACGLTETQIPQILKFPKMFIKLIRMSVPWAQPMPPCAWSLLHPGLCAQTWTACAAPAASMRPAWGRNCCRHTLHLILFHATVAGHMHSTADSALQHSTAERCAAGFPSQCTFVLLYCHTQRLIPFRPADVAKGMYACMRAQLL